MQDPQLNQWVTTIVATACVLSIAVGFHLFQRHVDGRPLLEYEPRRRVPWGPLVLTIPVFFLVIGFLPILGDEETAAEPPTPHQFIVNGLIISVFMIAFVPAAMAWLASERRADSRDLGLPQTSAQFWQDVRYGCIACLAALLPILLINYFLNIIFQPDQMHPLIEQLQNNGSTEMLLVGIVSAVLAAPLFEEFTFRMLLQGWLERLEDERLDFQATEREPTVPVEIVKSDTDFERFAAEPKIVEELPAEQEVTRPERGWLGVLPHGWMPIIVSGVIFGLAHFGHGVAPVPLVFLGIVLGYLYQRTHRIVPCIAAHMLFNSYSMILLWLSLEEL